MLTDFLNEDGSLKEKITAATGQEISLSERYSRARRLTYRL